MQRREGAPSGTARVLLIYPPVRLAAPPRVPPMGYLYLGAVLEEAGISVEILDLNVLRLPIDDVMAEVRRREFDVIGIGGMTTVYYYLELLSLMLKREFPTTPIMGGGSACSASPQTVLESTGVDVVCIGEGEPIIVELVEALTARRPIDHIPGIAYRASDGSIVRTAERERFAGWRGMAFPAHHLVDMEVYIRNNAIKYLEVPGLKARVAELGIEPRKAARPIHIFSKRGCPFGCTFCYRNFGRKVVYDAPEHVADYMEYLGQRYDTAHFVFGDELFNVDHGWVEEFCDVLSTRKTNYLLSTNNGLRANCITEEGLLQMKSVGFYRLGIGIESFYDPSLKMMKKNQTAKQIVDAINLTEKLGLSVDEGGMLFGYETDSWEAMRENVRVLTELRRFNTGFSIPCPYPGTYLYERARKLGMIKDERAWLMELADRDVADRVINTSGIPDDELQEIVEWGVDQLAINSIADRFPILFRVLNRVQPWLRRRFDASAVDWLYNLKRGRIRPRSSPHKKFDGSFNMDGLNITNRRGLSGLSADMKEGERYLVAEALERLEHIDNSHVNPLPFLVPTEAEPSSQTVATESLLKKAL